MSNSLWTHGLYSLPGSSVHRILSIYTNWSGLSFPWPGDLPDAGTEPASFISPALAGGFCTTSATWEKPHFLYESENISHSVMSNSATPWIVACQVPLSMGFSRQKYWSTLGLLHCRQILYCLSHQGNPSFCICVYKFFFILTPNQGLNQCW